MSLIFLDVLNHRINIMEKSARSSERSKYSTLIPNDAEQNSGREIYMKWQFLSDFVQESSGGARLNSYL